MEPFIRDATYADSAAIVWLIRGLAETPVQESPLTETYVRGYLDAPNSRVLLAVREEHVIGLLSYSMRPNLYHAAPCCFIEELVVDASERGKGIGTELMRALLARTEKEKCAEVSLTVMPENTSAQRFYRRLGITEEVLCLERHF